MAITNQKQPSVPIIPLMGTNSYHAMTFLLSESHEIHDYVLVPPQRTARNEPAVEEPIQPQTTSIWQGIINWFSGIFISKNNTPANNSHAVIPTATMDNNNHPPRPANDLWVFDKSDADQVTRTSSSEIAHQREITVALENSFSTPSIAISKPQTNNTSISSPANMRRNQQPKVATFAVSDEEIDADTLVEEENTENSERHYSSSRRRTVDMQWELDRSVDPSTVADTEPSIQPAPQTSSWSLGSLFGSFLSLFACGHPAAPSSNLPIVPTLH